jgi:hypothetical protein
MAAPNKCLAKNNKSRHEGRPTKAQLADQGGTVLPGSPADFGKLIADETEKWGKVIRAANIKPVRRLETGRAPASLPWAEAFGCLVDHQDRITAANELIGHKLTQLCRVEGGDGENARPTVVAASVPAAARPRYADRRAAAP